MCVGGWGEGGGEAIRTMQVRLNSQQEWGRVWGGALSSSVMSPWAGNVIHCPLVDSRHESLGRQDKPLTGLIISRESSLDWTHHQS